jgi:ABC-type multidrug transport system fused ATPase/permease subunit
VLLNDIWPFVRPQRKRYRTALMIIVALTVVEVASPLLLSVTVDLLLGRFLADQASLFVYILIPLIVALIGLAIARGVLTAWHRTVAGQIGERVTEGMRAKLWNHLQDLPLDYTRKRGAGRLLLRFNADTRSVQRIVTEGMIRLPQELLLGVVALIAVSMLNWRLGVVLLFMVPIFAFIFRHYNPQLRKASQATRRRRSQFSAYVNDRINGLAAVKLYVRQQTETLRVEELSRKVRDRAAKLAAQHGYVQGYTAATIALGGCLTLLVAAAETAAGRLTPGALVATYVLIGMLLPVFQRAADVNRQAQEARLSLDRLKETLAQKRETTPNDGQATLKISDGTITFEKVGFRYSKEERLVHNVSFSAQRGEIIAVVGPNGAGKSTLIDLLLRFKEATRGTISIDGQAITDVSLDSLRRQIGLVGPEAPLFEGTIAQALAYGVRTGIPEEQIQRAAQLTGIDKLIAELPDGWQTKIGNRGRTFSNGQRQLIALARAIAGDPPIVVLDEATNAVDTETEMQIAGQLRQIAANKTVIVVSHRQPLLAVADRIVVMNRGRVQESGTHAELIERDGLYARLFGTQTPESDEL